MSFTTDRYKKSELIAIVNGGKQHGKKIYHNPDPKMGGSKEFTLPNNDTSRFLFNKKNRVFYIAGPSGSGKTTYAAELIKNIKPKDDKLYLLSSIDKDSNIDHLKPKRIIIDEEWINDPIEHTQIPKNSFILFDDCDNISNKKIQNNIFTFMKQLLNMGRHRNITVIITSHLINPIQANARHLLNELQSITIFPQSGGHHQIAYYLKRYGGLTDKKINEIMENNKNSRSITFNQTSPLFYLSDKKIKAL